MHLAVRHRTGDNRCLARSFIAIDCTSPEIASPIAAKLSLDKSLLFCRVSETAFLAYRPHQTAAVPHYPARDQDSSPTVVVGDDTEPDCPSSSTPMGYAATVEANSSLKNIRALASMVALPPIFIYTDPPGLWNALTSSWELLRSLDQCSFQLDPLALIQYCLEGCLGKDTTLFRNVSLVPAGHEVVLKDSRVVLRKLWELPDRQNDEYDLREYTGRQIEAFDTALSRLDRPHEFLSLTGGLDTRAILAGLVRRNRTIPARTLIGDTVTLDGAIAQDLCRAYDIEHELVALSDAFRTNLSAYALKASLQSGGLASLEEAHEVYFHEVVSEQFQGRVSAFWAINSGAKEWSAFRGERCCRRSFMRTSAR